MAMSALAAALAISSTTETMIARNHQNAAQARAAAEAGLTHALDLTLDYLSVWQADFMSVDLAIDALLTNPTMYITDFGDVQTGVILAGIGTSYSSITLSNGSFSSIFYEAMLIDDDNQTVRDLVLSADDLTRMGEPDGDPDDDQNQKFVVRAIGYAGGNAVAAVEALISPQKMPGLLTDGDLELGGSFSIIGDQGSVHTNGDFSVKGSAWSASEGCTATGTSEDEMDCPPGQPTMAVPDKSADDYLSLAKYILHDDGEMTTVGTGTKAACDPCAGAWEFSSGTWTLSDTLDSAGAPDGSIFYVEGDVTLGTPNTVTVFATGSISAGHGTWEPAAPGLLFVVDGDYSDTGNPVLGTSTNPGLMIIGEQINVKGTLVVHGAIIVRDATANDSTVTANLLTGNVTIEYNGELDGSFFGVSAWRRSY
jgi:hypothetical protein